MLILAGISVSVLFGEGGIIDKARLAGEKTNAAVENEQRMLNDIADWMDAVNDKMPETLAEAASTKYQFKVTTKMKDSDGKTITIPKGFHVVGSEEDDTVKYGDDASNEPKVSDGIVIQDADGNQFVWVPVDEVNIKYEEHKYTGANKNDAGTNVKDENDGGWDTWDYRKYEDWTNNGENKESVSENKGFYIARYEAGVPENASFHVSTENADEAPYSTDKNKTTNDGGTNLKPVSKAKTQAWNYISQPNAKTVSTNMYSGANVGVTSSLVDGTAWDTVVTWIAKEEAHKDIVKDSTQYGNYANSTGGKVIYSTGEVLYAEHLIEDNKGSKKLMSAKNYTVGTFTSGRENYSEKPIDQSKFNTSSGKEDGCQYYKYKEMATGASEGTKLKNIYDLAGNMFEWTTETGYHDEKASESARTQYAVLRGGNCFTGGSESPVSCRDGKNTLDYTDIAVGFRVIFYVN